MIDPRTGRLILDRDLNTGETRYSSGGSGRGSAGNSSYGTRYTPPRPSRARVTIRTPSFPVYDRGTFSYYTFIWDGRDVGVRELSDELELTTTPGTHTLEVRQLSNGIFRTHVLKSRWTVTIDSDAILDVYDNAGSIGVSQRNMY